MHVADLPKLLNEAIYIHTHTHTHTHICSKSGFAMKTLMGAACILDTTTLRYQAATNTVFSAQLSLLHIYCFIEEFRQLCYVQQSLSNSFVKFFTPWWWASVLRNLKGLVCYNIVVVLIKLWAFVGSNCNNCFLRFVFLNETWAFLQTPN